jgi:hypothetical protein
VGSVADIFFSYKSEDRERVRPVRDALVAQGFDVFWDQQVPAGVDWDTWIRQELAQAKCALVFWSAAAVASRNVRHEATVAMEQGKLIPVLLEPLRADQFPMGLYTTQGVNLAGWDGDVAHAEWDKLRREVEVKLTPLWVQRQIHELQGELIAERARREAAEARDRSWQAQIARVAQAEQEARRERDNASDGMVGLRAELEAKARECAGYEARLAELSRRLEETQALRQTLAERLEASSQKATDGRGTTEFTGLQAIGMALIFSVLAAGGEVGSLFLLAQNIQLGVFPPAAAGVLSAGLVSTVVAWLIISHRGLKLLLSELVLYWLGSVGFPSFIMWPLFDHMRWSFFGLGAELSGVLAGAMIFIGSGTFGLLHYQRQQSSLITSASEKAV